MTRRLFLLLAALCLSACSSDAPEEMPPPPVPGSPEAAATPLVVGMDMTYPPFEFKNTKGEPDGVDVRMAEALAAELGRPLKLESLPFDGLIPALKSGQIDIVISAMTANDERKKSIDFSDSYAFTGLAILVGKDSPIQSVEDLKKPGVRITSKLGTTGEVWARKNVKNPEDALILDSEPACVLEVVQGRADALVYDQLSIYQYHKQNAAQTKALLQPFQEEEWAIGLKKGNHGLRKQVNEFLTKFRAAGGMSKLADQYLADERKLLEGMGIPFILR